MVETLESLEIKHSVRRGVAEQVEVLDRPASSHVVCPVICKHFFDRVFDDCRYPVSVVRGGANE